MKKKNNDMLTVMSIKLADFPEVLVQKSHLFSLIKTQLQIFISEKSILGSDCEQKENNTSSQEEKERELNVILIKMIRGAQGTFSPFHLASETPWMEVLGAKVY